MNYKLLATIIAIGALASCHSSSLGDLKSAAVVPQISPEQDAYVAGTAFNAVAGIQCSGLRGSTQSVCNAGVIRHQDGSAEVIVNEPSNRRILYFDKAGRGIGVIPASGPFYYSINGTGMITIRSGLEVFAFPIEFLRGD